VSTPSRKKSVSLEKEKHDQEHCKRNLCSHENLRKTFRWFLGTTLLSGAGIGGGYLAYENMQLRDRQNVLKTTLDDMSSRTNQRLNQIVSLSDLDEAAEYVTPATVRVEGPLGLGSGVIVTDRLGRKYILTNGHVTEGNSFKRGDWMDFQDAVYKVTMYTGNDFKDDGISFDAAPVVSENGKRAHSFSDKRDLALLALPPDIERRIMEGEIAIPTIHLWNHEENTLRVGTPVIAVGNPFGEPDHVTQGIISHTQASGGSLEPENVFVRTSAPINPGNSGGGLFAVVRENGELKTYLVGINTWGYNGGDGVSGSIDVRIIVLEAYKWGIPLVSDTEIKKYQIWWKDEIEPRLREQGILEDDLSEDSDD